MLLQKLLLTTVKKTLKNLLMSKVIAKVVAGNFLKDIEKRHPTMAKKYK